ncbi:hypothetical protein ABVT39_026906 [Epinephelus coioides]
MTTDVVVETVKTKLSRVKSFEFFLLGLAAANLEGIVVVNIYDIVILQIFSTTINTWSCSTLKFLTVFGEITTILFTVLISIFRQQKLRDASKRVNLPIYLDSIKSAWMVSGICVMLATILSLPVFVLNSQGSTGNTTSNISSCPPDFFACSRTDCPVLNGVYKYMFILVCYLLPLLIVTVTSCLIIMVLLSQRKVVTPAIDWTLYLIFQLTVSPAEFPLWAETEFFISTSYTSISPINLCNITEKTHWLLLTVTVIRHESHISHGGLLSLIRPV